MLSVLKNILLIWSKHFLFMLTALYFWKLQHSDSFEARTKMMDFSSLGYSLHHCQGKIRVAALPLPSLSVFLEKPGCESWGNLVAGQEFHYAQLEEIAVCLLLRHVRTCLPSISYVALTMTYPRIRWTKSKTLHFLNLILWGLAMVHCLTLCLQDFIIWKHYP